MNDQPRREWMPNPDRTFQGHKTNSDKKQKQQQEPSQREIIDKQIASYLQKLKFASIRPILRGDHILNPEYEIVSAFFPDLKDECKYLPQAIESNRHLNSNLLSNEEEVTGDLNGHIEDSGELL